MIALVAHVRKRLDQLLAKPSIAKSPTFSGNLRLDSFDLAESAAGIMRELCGDAHQSARHEFLDALKTLGSSDENSRLSANLISELSSDTLTELAVRPGTMAWRQTISAQAAGRTVHTVDGMPVHADGSYLQYLLSQLENNRGFSIGDADPWLRAPFGNAIQFEDEDVASQARPLVEEALSIIAQWRPALAAEMRLASRAIQFVRDPLAHPEKIVSFSDNSVPGALYVSVVQGDGLIDPYDLADSLVHEHRHQKLYLLERIAPTIEADRALVTSPWREDLRPPSGLLHAVFVFVELRRFWIFVRDQGPDRLHNRAISQLRDTEENLAEAFATLASCPLTDVGEELVAVLKAATEAELMPA
jgi:uncharacterized protein